MHLYPIAPRGAIITLLVILGHLPAFSQCDLGRNYAVFFAVEEYDDATGYSSLSYPIEDAEELATILSRDYGFDTTILRNPIREEIWEELYELRKKSDWGPDDQLLLFFTGHGERGYFIPRDGRAGRLQSTSIPLGNEFKDSLHSIGCNHQLLVLDACYSGSLFTADWRSGSNAPGWQKSVIPRKTDQNLAILCRHRKRRTRLSMTAASGQEQTADASRLVQAFSKLLNAYSDGTEILYTGSIYMELKSKASSPLFDEFHFKNHEASSFLFVPRQVREDFASRTPCPLDDARCAPDEECLACPTDPEDQTYEVVPVGPVYWMTQNLSYSLGQTVANGHYTWEQARQACEALGPGWRLPTKQEWAILTQRFGEGHGVTNFGAPTGNPKESFRKFMRPESPWQPALVGFLNDRNKPRGKDKQALYWSGTEANLGADAVAFSFSSNPGVYQMEQSKNMKLSCRCVRGF